MQNNSQWSINKITSKKRKNENFNPTKNAIKIYTLKNKIDPQRIFYIENQTTEWNKTMIQFPSKFF